MKKALVVLASVVIILVMVTFVGLNILLNADVGNKPVAYYDNRVEIWEDVAGNNNDIKLDHMNVDLHRSNLSSTLAFIKALVGDSYVDNEKDIDTFTYKYEIEAGYESEKFDDQPYIIPYLVDDSDEAVLVIPGGGYAQKSMDGGGGESDEVARTLNDNNINAFVLHYRSNPYQYPIPQLDVQRAVRYIKFHSNEFGVDSAKLGLIGYSAGGNQVGTYLNVIQGNDYFPQGYQVDEVDKIDDSVSFGAMIYPALTYEYNIPMLFSSFDGDDVRNQSTRAKLLEMLDLSKHINQGAPKQFISYSIDDRMVDYRGTDKYVESASNQGVDLVTSKISGQDHTYKQEYYMKEFLEWYNELY